MLRIYAQNVGANVARYFTEGLEHNDYYTKEALTPGVWVGSGSELFGLSGKVERDHFLSLLLNRYPDTDTRITPRDKSNRRTGYDISFHAPKSVSVMFGLTGDMRILEAFERAVKQSIPGLESKLQVRVRRDGANEDRDAPSLVGAMFTHFTARPVNGDADPHLHAHVFALNMAYDDIEHRWKAGQFGKMKANAPGMEQAFHYALRSEMVLLGYDVDPESLRADLTAVPKELSDTFSQRTKQIDSVAKEMGLYDPKAKDSLGAKTRERKQSKQSLRELQHDWAARAGPVLVDRLTSARDKSHENKERWNRLNDELSQTVERMQRASGESSTTREGRTGESPSAVTNTRPEATAADTSTRPEMTPEELNRVVRDCLQTSTTVRLTHVVGECLRRSKLRLNVTQLERQILSLPDVLHKEVGQSIEVTNREALEAERRLVQTAREGRASMGPLASGVPAPANKAISEYNSRVLRELFASQDPITLVKMSGAGRRDGLKKLAIDAVDLSNHACVVVSPTTNGARESERELGRKDVCTVQRFVKDDQLQFKLLGPDHGAVIWVEDAARVGVRQLNDLCEVAEKRRARIVLCGDEQLVRAHDRTNALRLLREEAGLKSAELRAWNQPPRKSRRFAERLREGNVDAALNELRGVNHYRVMHAEACVLTATVRRFEKSLEFAKSSLAVVATDVQARRVNQAIRKLLRREGYVNGPDRSVLQLTVVPEPLMGKKHANIKRGMVVDFSRSCPGFRPGERARVLGTDPLGGVWVRKRGLAPTRISPAYRDRFAVSQASRTHIAEGDLIRITRNVRDNFKRQLRTGSIRRVAGFVPLSGDIILDGGYVLRRKFGHFEHAYATSIRRSAGRTADFIALGLDGKEIGFVTRDRLTTLAESSRQRFELLTNSGEKMESQLRRASTHVSAIEIEEEHQLRVQRMHEKQNAEGQRRRVQHAPR